ncbi:MAG TPA: hypothetical protein VHE59_00055 [Mucilaginibacter sp.]|nr:hypothetical protein [Mucilaginibacter sp.]
MKKVILSIVIAALAICCKAQDDKPTFPFQGGNEVMAQFFRDSVKLSPEIMKVRASGIVIFKFSADEKGAIKNVMIYYADDVALASPLVDALKKSSHKWIIPFKEKEHDFVIPFQVKFTTPEKETEAERSAMYTYYKMRKPIIARDQTPLYSATLLPTVIVNYGSGQ